jgi:hypothetical protein
MHELPFVFFLSSLLAFSTLANSELLVSDSFESGDMTTRSEIGFRWDNTPKTSVVTATTEVFNTSLLNEPAPATSQWEAKTGTHALLFRYPAGEPWIEQRFTFDEPQPELWMSFWLRVPINYSHPKVEGAGDNQKLFRLWMDKYSGGDGTKVGMEFRGAGGGSSYFYGKIGNSQDLDGVRFITVPDDRDKWMHLVVHVDSESSAGAKDGLMEVWRKWEGESDYTKTHDFKNQPINLSSTVKGFRQGYLLGWANAHYPVETDFLIDDFELSTSPLFSSSTAPGTPTQFNVK